MKNRLFSIVLVFLLSISIVSASGLILSEENSQEEIKNDGSATFDLVVKNDDREARDIFIAFPYSTDWRVNIEPYLLRLPSKGTGTAKIQVFSLSDKNFGAYELVFNLKSRDGEVKQDYVHKIKVVPFTGDEIATQLIMDDRIDPRTTGKIKLKLENMRKFNFKDLEISIKCQDIFSERRFIDLTIGETKLEEFTFTFPENIAPDKYNVKVEIKYGNRLVGRTEKSFVLSTFSDIIEKVNEEGRYLTRKTTISRINGGTTEKRDKITVSVSRIKKIFTSFSKAPDSFDLKDGVYVAEWNFKLSPGESFDVEVIRNYTVALWSVAIVILLALFIAQLRKKRIVVTKRVLDVKRHDEGIHGMKVMLRIRNKGGKPIGDVKLIDSLPLLIGTAPHSFSTLYPTKIKTTAYGTIKLIWHLNELRGGEERVISYVANSRLSILGKLILPCAVAVYMKGRRKIKSKSNRLILFSSLQDK